MTVFPSTAAEIISEWEVSLDFHIFPQKILRWVAGEAGGRGRNLLSDYLCKEKKAVVLCLR